MCDRVVDWMFGFSYANNIRFIAVLLRRVDIENVADLSAFYSTRVSGYEQSTSKKKPGESQAFDV